MAASSELGELALAIKKQVNDFTNPGNSSEISCFNATFTEPRSKTDYEWELQHLLLLEEADDRKLAVWRKLTDITFISCTSQLISEDDSRKESRHIHEGETHGIQFLARFTLIEHKTAGGDGSLEIPLLDVEIIEQVYAEVEPFLKTVVDCSSLYLFYRGFAKYAFWWQQRDHAFNHFTNKYPGMVSMPRDGEGMMLRIQHPNLKGLRWNLYWLVSVSDTGEATPDMYLTTTAPEQMITMDTEERLQEAPDMFRKLLHVLGVERAIESLIVIAGG